MSQFLTVKSWERFQHYKDRDPPWVKLYRDMLTSEAWVLGTDLSRCLQTASTLLAARYNNKIPYRFDLLKKVLSLDCTESAFSKAISHLISTDFLEIQEVTKDEKLVAQSASKTIAECSSESEKSREETEKRSNGHQTVVPTDVSVVFDHWKQIHGHPQSKLDEKRTKLIRVALSAYTPEQLCLAISGYKNSPHHMGKNDRQTVYDDIEVFLRDAKHIDAGIKFADAGAPQKWQ